MALTKADIIDEVVKQDTSSLTRQLNPSEVEALKKDLCQASKQLKGRFKHLNTPYKRKRLQPAPGNRYS